MSIERRIVFNKNINLIKSDHRISPGTGNIWIDQSNHHISAFNCGKRCIDRGSKRNISMFVRYRNHNQSYINLEISFTDQFLSFAKENRDIISITSLSLFAKISSDKELLCIKYSFKFRVSIINDTFNMEVLNFYIIKFSGTSTFNHCID